MSFEYSGLLSRLVRLSECDVVVLVDVSGKRNVFTDSRIKISAAHAITVAEQLHFDRQIGNRSTEIIFVACLGHAPHGTIRENGSGRDDRRLLATLFPARAERECDAES